MSNNYNEEKENYKETNKKDCDIMDCNIAEADSYMFPINGTVRANAYSKDVFEKRTAEVFEVLWKILSKSFGPYGAPTVISQYPYYHVTKDGYTIFKNTNLDTSNNIVDKIISGMAMDICGRLNNTVGDGTTTAVISTYMIYKCYQEYKDYFKDNLILPRNIIKRFNLLRDQLVEMLRMESISIQSDDPDELGENIRKVAWISSNADEEISDMITNLYKELGCPKITPMLSPDGETRSYVIDGYQAPVKLLDRLYINSDDDIAKYSNLDVLIFDHKVTMDTYDYILKPMTRECKSRGRHLLCIAPSYDTVALDGKIGTELNNEYAKEKDVSLILAAIFNSSPLTKLMMSDLAMFLNTRMITSSQERKIIDHLSLKPGELLSLFNLDSRKIKGTQIAYVLGVNANNVMQLGLMTDNGNGVDEKGNPYEKLVEDYIRVGFVKTASCGLEKSTFRGFEYDEKKFEGCLKEAEENLRKAVQKYSKLGTFNVEISNAQKRLHALRMKMGLIEVGGNSDLSQKLLKDAVDDTIKACSSAYEYGVIKGCNVTLLRILNKMIASYGLCEDSRDKELSLILLRILEEGFRSVYKTVLSNAFDDFYISINENCIVESFLESAKKYIRCEFKHELMEQAIWKSVEEVSKKKHNDIDRLWIPQMASKLKKISDTVGGKYCNLFDVIINYSILSDSVFNLDSMSFDTTIVNSMETDKEVLNATSDLMSLLIAGNQLIVNAYRD